MQWQKGTPAKPGWYPASNHRNPAIIRWWPVQLPNGKQTWSTAVDKASTAERAAELATRPDETVSELKIEWLPDMPTPEEEAVLTADPGQEKKRKTNPAPAAPPTPAASNGSEEPKGEQQPAPARKQHEKRVPSVEQNGMRRPTRGMTLAMWELFDKDPALTAEQLPEVAKREGWSIGLLRSHYRQHKTWKGGSK